MATPSAATARSKRRATALSHQTFPLTSGNLLDFCHKAMRTRHGADRIGTQPTLTPPHRTNHAEFLPGRIGAPMGSVSEWLGFLSKPSSRVRPLTKILPAANRSLLHQLAH